VRVIGPGTIDGFGNKIAPKWAMNAHRPAGLTAQFESTVIGSL
jgi:hypothetical protein